MQVTFGLLLTILRARSRLIASIVIAVTAAAAAVSMMLPKRYEAESSVMVQPAEVEVMPGTNSPRPSFEKVDNLVSTHADLIASPAVALRVVERLGLERDPRAEELLAGAGPLKAVRDRVAELQTMMSGLLAGEHARSAEMSRRDWMASRLLRKLELKLNRDSRLIRIRFSAADPEFSSRVANAFAQSYLDTLLQLRVKPAQQGTRWLEQQVGELKRDLEAAEARLAQFQQEKGIVASDERLDLETGRLNELSAQLAVAHSQSYESQARQRQLREFLNRGGGEPPADVLASPVVQQLKQSVADREAKLAEMSRRVGPNHPQFLAAQTELQDLKRQLNQQLRATAESLLTTGGVWTQREAALRSALEQQRNRVLKLKGYRNELAILAREVDNAQRAYSAAAQRLAQLKMESEVDQSTGSIIAAAAVPTRPAGPNLPLNVLLAMAAGLALGVGLALSLESVNRHVRSAQDLDEIIGLPVLAVLGPRYGARHNVRYLKSPNIYSLPRA